MIFLNYCADAKFFKFVMMPSAADCVWGVMPVDSRAKFFMQVLTSSVAVLLTELVKSVPA